MTTQLTNADDQMRTFTNQLTRQEEEFGRALPAQMPAAKFVRCIMTAVQRDPKLLLCDRKSLWSAAMQAAQDGLYPDGRYGIILPYSTNVAKRGEPPKWVSVATWQPMILGVYSKLHNSGKLESIAAHVVYENDFFEYHQGDSEQIVHEAPKGFTDRGKPVGVYAIAKTTNGGVYREVMSVADVEKIRDFSKSKDSPAWRGHWDEMAKVKVVRRLAKRLPLSADDMGWLMDEGEQEPERPAERIEFTHGVIPEMHPLEYDHPEAPATPDWEAIRQTNAKRLAELNAAELPSDVEPPAPEEINPND